MFSLKFDQFDPFSQMTQKVCYWHWKTQIFWVRRGLWMKLSYTQTYCHCYHWEKYVSILLDYLYISSDEIDVSRIIAGKIWFNISRHQGHIIKEWKASLKANIFKVQKTIADFRAQRLQEWMLYCQMKCHQIWSIQIAPKKRS